jgi:hypothetical protein
MRSKVLSSNGIFVATPSWTVTFVEIGSELEEIERLRCDVHCVSFYRRCRIMNLRPPVQLSRSLDEALESL